MPDSLFEVTKTLLAYSEADGEICKFEVGRKLLVSDEPDLPRVVNGKREKVVRFRQAQPPAENVPWLWFFVTRPVFDASTRAVRARTSPALYSGENQDLLDDLFPIAVPKPGDTLMFPDGHSDKVHSVFDGMVWRVDPNKPDNIRDRPIPVGDFVPSGEPKTWVYNGDTDIK